MNQPLRLSALVVVCLGVCAQLLAQAGALRIVVIKGEDAVNIIQQKTAVAPVVEVRDRNNLPVAGATVVFSINGSGASFGAAQTLTVVTNAAGQATAAGITPSTAGSFNISAAATFQGQTAAVTISQSNVLTAAEAARTVGTAAKSGGMSAGKVIGIVGGIGAAGAGVAVAAGGSTSSTPAVNSTTQSPTTSTPTTPVTTTPTTPAPVVNRAPTIDSASITPNVALIAVDTPIALQAQASDADNDSLTYLWEFPDGTTSNQRAFTRVFQLGGTWRIRITVSDGKTSTSSELTLEMKTLTGNWAYSEQPGTTIFSLTQNGSIISGSFTSITPGGTDICPVSGSVRSSAPQIVMDRPTCQRGLATIAGAYFEFQADATVETLNGFNFIAGLKIPWTMVRR